MVMTKFFSTDCIFLLTFVNEKFSAAVIVLQKLNYPMMKVYAFKNSGLKVNEVIQIGDNSEDANRFATMKNVANKYLYVWTRMI